MKAFDRISIDPEVMGGQPCIKGTRVTVSVLVGLVAAGSSEDHVLELYPYLSRDDLRQAMAYSGDEDD